MSTPSLPPNVEGEIQTTLRIEVLSSPLIGEEISVHFWGLRSAIGLPADFPVRCDGPHFFAYLADMGDLKLSFASGAVCVVSLLPFLRGAKSHNLRIRGKFPVTNKLKLDVGKLELSLYINNWAITTTITTTPTTTRGGATTTQGGATTTQGAIATTQGGATTTQGIHGVTTNPSFRLRTSSDRLTESLKLKVLKLLDRGKQFTSSTGDRNIHNHNDFHVSNNHITNLPYTAGSAATYGTALPGTYGTATTTYGGNTTTHATYGSATYGSATYGATYGNSTTYGSGGDNGSSVSVVNENSVVVRSPHKEILRVSPPEVLKPSARAFALVDLQDPLWEGEAPSGSTRNSLRSSPSVNPSTLTTTTVPMTTTTVPTTAPRLSTAISTTWLLKSSGASPTLRFSPSGEATVRAKFPSGPKAPRLVLRVTPGGSATSEEFVFSSILVKYAELEESVALALPRLPEALDFALVERKGAAGASLASARVPVKASPNVGLDLAVEFRAGAPSGAASGVFGRMSFALVQEMTAWVALKATSLTGAEFVKMRCVGKAVLEDRPLGGGRDHLSLPTNQVRLRPDALRASGNSPNLDVVVEVWRDASLARLVALGRATLTLTPGGGVAVRCLPVAASEAAHFDFKVELVSQADARLEPAFVPAHEPPVVVSTKAATAYTVVASEEQLQTQPLEQRSVSALPELPAHVPVLDEAPVFDVAMDALMPWSTPASSGSPAWVATPPRLVAPAPIEAGFATPPPTAPLSEFATPLGFDRRVETLVGRAATPEDARSIGSPFERAVAAHLAALAETLEDLGANEVRDFHRRNMETLDADMRKLTGEPDPLIPPPPAEHADPAEAPELRSSGIEELSSSWSDTYDYDDFEITNLATRLRLALANLPFGTTDPEGEANELVVDEEAGLAEAVERRTREASEAEEMLQSAPSSPDEFSVRPPMSEVVEALIIPTPAAARLEVVRGEVLAVEDERSAPVLVAALPESRVFSLTEAEEVESELELLPSREADWRSEVSRDDRPRVVPVSLSRTLPKPRLVQPEPVAPEAVVVRRPEIPSFEERQFLRRQFKDRKRVSKILIGRDSSSDELSD